MHPESLRLMTEMLQRPSQEAGQRVLDVGAYDVNGTFRPLVQSHSWTYTGLDVAAGPNVDVVADNPYSFPFDNGTFDIVISGSTMEHVQAFWLWLPELVRVLRPGGYLAIHTHWKFQEHRFPVDCWRIMPDGMRFLFDSTNVLTDYDIRIANDMDIIGSAFKAAD